MLDTNVVLDLLVFRDASVEPLRSAIETGRVTLLSNGPCLAELRRVLAYPAFGLDAPAQGAAFAWFEARAERIAEAAAAESAAPVPQKALPRCRDADDQKFLQLAWAARASHLLTKDKALLELASRVAKLGRFEITPPGQFAKRLATTRDNEIC